MLRRIPPIFLQYSFLPAAFCGARMPETVSDRNSVRDSDTTARQSYVTACNTPVRPLLCVLQLRTLSPATHSPSVGTQLQAGQSKVVSLYHHSVRSAVGYIIHCVYSVTVLSTIPLTLSSSSPSTVLRRVSLSYRVFPEPF